jgi:hypothetical protein
MAGRGGGRGSGRQRFGGPGGRPRDDMRGGMRQDVSKLLCGMYYAYICLNVTRRVACFAPHLFGRFH